MDLLIGVDCADLHYSFVDIRGKVGEKGCSIGTAEMDLYWGP